MGKYNCTLAKDFLHEAARVRRECMADNQDCHESCPLMSELYGKETYRCIRHSSISDEIFMNIPDNEFSELVNKLQQWSDSHREVRELSGDEIAVLTGLKLLGYKYLAADKCGVVYGYINKPYKTEWDKWAESSAFDLAISVSYTGMFRGIADFSDDEPLEIEKLLREERI